ncbi:MAG: NblA/ycf18 family protein [Hydrococcus sp. C42_A2020_068]|uniref:NblA/ycf18 family protein n=1 Tax=Pleurocapsa sp. PCC 7327 TaxID=118163 RepID=UPI00029FBC93|nr:NblA/ycf18 family protein [Pleurocapsa sp. PCC 7327]AFY77889.1 Phycobilisome degradation protein nblA [Pleurocapsa sp. PCC 7327]MBF2019276.1 NblA/ycf18 family protein [Hydrococcus sp. C42_A2020_068]
MNADPLKLNLELTLEQQFQMRLMEQSAQEMSREQAISLLLETARLLMMKDNAIRLLVKQII